MMRTAPQFGTGLSLDQKSQGRAYQFMLVWSLQSCFFCLCNWERAFGGNLTLFGKVVRVWVRDRIQLKFSLWLNIAGVLFTSCWEWCKTICAFCSFCKLTLPYNCFIPFRDNFLKRISLFLCFPIVAWGKVPVKYSAREWLCSDWVPSRPGTCFVDCWEICVGLNLTPPTASLCSLDQVSLFFMG